MAEREQNNPTISVLRQKLNERLAREQLPKSTRLRYRVVGGMPSERLDQRFTLSGDGEVRVSTRDAMRSAKLRHSAGKLSQADTKAMFRQVEAELDNLVTREQAHFLPDSTIGTVTLEVAGRKQTFFFAVEEEPQAAPREFAAIPQFKPLSDRIRGIARKVQQEQGILQDHGILQDQGILQDKTNRQKKGGA